MTDALPVSPAQNRRAAWRRVYRMLRPYVWPHDWRRRRELLFGLAALAATRLFTLASPFFYKSSVDALTSQLAAAVAIPLGFILAYGAARLTSQIATYSQGVVFEEFFLRMTDEARRQFFQHLLDLSLRFHLERKTGAMTMVALRSARGMRYVLETALLNVVPMAVEIALVCAMLSAMYEPLYACVLLVAVALYAICTHRFTQAQGRLAQAVVAANDDADAAALDSLLNYETVKYFVKERHELARFDAGRTILRGALLNHIRGWRRLAFLQGLIITCGVVALTVAAAHDVTEGRMRIGDYVLVNTYFLQIFMPLHALGSVYNESRRAFVDMEAMLQIFATIPEVEDAPNAQPLRIDGGEIRFENVRFAYDGAHEILKGISFTIPAGKKTAIVGPTGAGKSTIARLLFRFYDVADGAIIIDGQDIRRVTQASLRAAIGVVPQDVVLFNDTIFYNIAYGSPEARSPLIEDIESAARNARLHDFVLSLPQRYATKVGERGLKLSGGEKQRVAIARTLLKAPHIFLFDEATSALDNRTETEIQHCLASVASGRTTIVIAHRLSTVADADEIIVLDKGRIAERGRHRDLLAAKGLYASLWRKQQAITPRSLFGLMTRRNSKAKREDAS